MLNEEFLTEALSGENKKKFLDFVNAWSVVNGESNLDSFMMGFRLGANFAYDIRAFDLTPVQSKKTLGLSIICMSLLSPGCRKGENFNDNCKL